MPKKSNKTAKDYENLGRMLASIYDSGYIDHKQGYKQSFIKGLITGFGGVVGATIVVALLLWVLHFFKQVPGVDPLIRTIDQTNESIKNK